MTNQHNLAELVNQIDKNRIEASNRRGQRMAELITNICAMVGISDKEYTAMSRQKRLQFNHCQRPTRKDAKIATMLIVRMWYSQEFVDDDMLKVTDTIAKIVSSRKPERMTRHTQTQRSIRRKRHAELRQSFARDCSEREYFRDDNKDQPSVMMYYRNWCSSGRDRALTNALNWVLHLARNQQRMPLP